jgi:YD repeat-containing protein
LTYDDGNHPHGATGYNGWTYDYDPNGNMTSRINGGQTYNLGYNAENQMTSVSGAATASFLYDGDGRQVKATVGGVTTVYLGGYYEWSSAGNTKYYFAAGQRVGMRRAGYAADNGLFWLFTDHDLAAQDSGSTSLRVGATGGSPLSELRYKAWGETRYTAGSMLTKDQFTGQRNEMEQLGLYFYNARWYDPKMMLSLRLTWEMVKAFGCLPISRIVSSTKNHGHHKHTA